MERYNLDKYDFTRYLLSELSDTRQDEFIFWKNHIPLPLDLVYNIFEKRGKLIRLYLDHISAALLYVYLFKKQGLDWKTAISVIPSKEILDQSSSLQRKLSEVISESGVIEMSRELSGALMTYDYTPEPRSLVNALTHDGRKYKRIYIPRLLKGIIERYNEPILGYIGISNADMFGNVVADELEIYRSGFSDAFAIIFNKLIDFIIGNHSDGEVEHISSRIKLQQARGLVLSDNENIKYDFITDGSVWEPRYVNARTTVVLNKKHPYIDLMRTDPGSEKVIAEIAEIMTEIENETIRDSDRRALEIARFELSRRLRAKAESFLINKNEKS